MSTRSEAMSRRSTRLDSFGYYDSEGEPFICYKEQVQKIFRRRRNYSQSSRQSLSISDTNSECDCGSNEASSMRDLNTTNDGNSDSNSKNFTKIFSLLFFLALCLAVFVSLNPTISSNFQSTGRRNIKMEKRFEAMEKLLRVQKRMLLELQDRLKLPLADTLPNFALEMQGADIIHSHSSSTYQPPSCVKMFGIPLFQQPKNPRIVIQGYPTLRPGVCWAFPGDRGHLLIALSHPIIISHVTLSHISKNLDPSGRISSAPREFSVFGMNTLDDEETPLGTFLYDQDGDQLQTFKLADHKNSVFNYVKLQVVSNWGHPDYTCLYNFRVHGKLQEGHQSEEMKPSSGCRW